MEIEIFKHFLKVFTYIIWNDKMMLGTIEEDDIMSLLNEKQVIDFYHFEKTKFKVKRSVIKKHLKIYD